jgi:structure-specific endonuclease subunit SLX1
MAEEKPCFVYLLLADSGNTYVGATVDLDRRLRQHNKEITGGAHATGAKVAAGEKWIRVCHVKNFPTWQAALQFEWRWKSLSRKKDKLRMMPLERRLSALQELLSLDRATTKAVPYSEWPIPPKVVQEIDSGLFLLLDQDKIDA